MFKNQILKSNNSYVNMNNIQLENFLNRQTELEKDMKDIHKIMIQFEKSEKISIQHFYENKDIFEVLIEYSQKFNLYNYSEFEYFYNYVKDSSLDNKKILISILNSFIVQFQELNFNLNLFVNTYIENIINYKMTLDLLSKDDLNMNVHDNSYKLWDIYVFVKNKFVEKEICELIWVKTFKWSLKSILYSWFNNKISFYHFTKTSWKFKKLTDYKSYLFFRQLYFRYTSYQEELWKEESNELFDVFYQYNSQSYLLDKNISALINFAKSFYEILHHYPLVWDLKLVLRSIFLLFNISYLPNWELNAWIIDEILKNKHIDNKILEDLRMLKKLLREIIDILYLSTYSKEIEDYKLKNDLSDNEYEQFKDFRFACLFMSGNTIFYTYHNLDKWINEKLKNDEYFSIIKKYWLDVGSVYWSYARFIKSDIDELKDKIKILNKEGLSKLFISDIEYISRDLARIKVRK